MESSSAVKKHVKSARHRNARNFFASLSKIGRCTETPETKGEEEESEIFASDESGSEATFSDESSSETESSEGERAAEKEESNSDVVDVELVTREKPKKKSPKKKFIKTGKVFQCSECTLEFSRKFNFQRHVKTHAEKTIACAQCGAKLFAPRYHARSL